MVMSKTETQLTMNFIYYFAVLWLLVLGVYGDLTPEGSAAYNCEPGKEGEDIINGVSVPWCCDEKCEKIAEIDIMIPGNCCDERRRLNPAPIDGESFWKNGYVPYVIEAGFADGGARVNEAIAEWQSKTNIRFGVRVSEADYVTFANPGVAGRCNSFIGKQGGAQTINIGDGCSAGNTVHEIGHALGMHHTQTREDRDQYLNIDWAAIDRVGANWRRNYEQVNVFYDDCLKYDYGSIMHYGPNLGAEAGVLTATNPVGAPFGQRDGLSIVDAGCMDGHYSPCRVALFTDDNFGGREYSPYGSDDYTLGELFELEFDDNTISSMKIVAEPDTVCTVDLFGSNNLGGSYSDWWANIVADNSKQNEETTFEYTMAQLTEEGFINNELSSLKVNQQATCTITLYQHDDFTGNAYGPFAVGDYTLAHLLAKGFSNDDITSMRVRVLGGEECVVNLYEHDYEGWEATITVSNPYSRAHNFDYSMADLMAAGFGNDQLSSMKINVNNWYQSGQAISCGQKISGNRGPYEVAKYVFETQRDYQSIYLEACESTHDTWLYVYDYASNQIASADDQFAHEGQYSCGNRYAGDIDIPNPTGKIASGTGYAFGVGGYSSNYGAYTIELVCDLKCYPRGSCNYGYMDKTEGNTRYWYCGMHCEGGKYRTDSGCGCACVPASGCAAAGEVYWSDYTNYLYYVVGVLVAVNVICFAVYCLRKRGKPRYQKVLSMETDIESQ